MGDRWDCAVLPVTHCSSNDKRVCFSKPQKTWIGGFHKFRHTNSPACSLWLSIYLPSFAPPSLFNQPTRQQEQVGWQAYINLFLLDTSSLLCAGASQKCLCLQNMCVLCQRWKLQCVSLLTYANVNGECGSWGSVPPSSRSVGSFAASRRELQKPILTSPSKDAEEFLFLWKCRVVLIKNTPRLMLLSVWVTAERQTQPHLDSLAD